MNSYFRKLEKVEKSYMSTKFNWPLDLYLNISFKTSKMVYSTVFVDLILQKIDKIVFMALIKRTENCVKAHVFEVDKRRKFKSYL